MTSPEEEANGPVIRDRRRIDPETGQVRDAGRPGGAEPRTGRHAAPPPAPAGPSTAIDPGHGNGNGGNGNGGASAAADAAALALAERTADLQRLQAEYA